MRPRTISRRGSPRPIRRPSGWRTSGRSSRIPSVLMVVGAGIPGDRAGMALRAMRAGKDVMVDKPGCTTAEQLADLRRTQADTGRILVGLLFGALPAEGDGRRLAAGGGGGDRAGGEHRRARAAPARPQPAAGLVLGHGAGRAYPGRHRLAPVRAVPAFHRVDVGAGAVERGGELRQSLAEGVERLRARGGGVGACDRVHPGGLDDGGGVAGLGGRAAVPDGDGRQHRAAGSTWTPRGGRAGTICS